MSERAKKASKNTATPKQEAEMMVAWLNKNIDHTAPLVTAKRDPDANPEPSEEYGALMSIVNEALGWRRWRAAAVIDDAGKVTKFTTVDAKEMGWEFFEDAAP